MSAAGRGAIRHPDDYYASPGWSVRAILPFLLALLPASGTILEPAAGEGAIVRELLSAGISPRRIGLVEIDEQRAHVAAGVLGHVVGDNDFLGVNCEDFRSFHRRCREAGTKFDLVISNPPFSLAMEFVRMALSITKPGGAVVMLLRMPWFGSQERAPWLRANTPTINTLDRRPSFYEGAPPTPQVDLFGNLFAADIDGSGSDNTEYAWFEWRLDDAGNLAKPTVRMLDCEKIQKVPSRRRAA